MALPRLRKVDLSSHSYINDSSFLNLCKGCKFLEEVIIKTFLFLSQDGIASAIRERPTLRSLSITNCLTWNNSESNGIQENFRFIILEGRGSSWFIKVNLLSS
ncbi:unnamed protein product [Trifolium pratense]|uniref:Uncharacterized protein n=1 Tax=Trifolium pratense TaxID=57577 RepID=A0ACB0KIB1_TRIPR|nr:unnamed protein product [Trifolium pratense]